MHMAHSFLLYRPKDNVPALEEENARYRQKIYFTGKSAVGSGGETIWRS